MSVYVQRGVLKGCHILTSPISGDQIWCSDLPGMTGGGGVFQRRYTRGDETERGCLDLRTSNLVRQYSSHTRFAIRCFDPLAVYKRRGYSV
jgi:hypothetical protein